MACEVEVILQSYHRESNTFLSTMRLRYWRAIHSEFMTHRVFSRNAGSSRAKPVKKVLAQVWNDPAGPIHWGQNQAGMQASSELQGMKRWLAQKLWKGAGRVACIFAWGMMKLGLHKQVANRILEPWQYIDVLVSATEWTNFFELRDHPDAQPEIRELAQAMADAMDNYPTQVLVSGEWHIPYILENEKDYPLELKLKLSTARCARVSYEPFDGNASIEKEKERHDLLVGSRPIHASPTEHQARASFLGVSNFVNFTQYRWYVERNISPDDAL
jgi:hypothetical protein